VPGFVVNTPPSTAAPEPAPTTAVPTPVAPAHVDPFAGTKPAAAVASRPGLQVTGQIEIPRIGLVHTTYEGNTLPVIDHGPSHWPGTAMPGDVGNTVYAGHRVTHTHPFLDLDLVRPGDSVIFTTAAGRFAYVVDETIIVTPNELWIVDPTPTATFTIFGCHPKHQKTHRIVVRGHLVAADRTPQAAFGGVRPAPAPAPSAPAPAPTPPPSTTTTSTPPPSSSGASCTKICLRP
jgi:sortase A